LASPCREQITGMVDGKVGGDSMDVTSTAEARLAGENFVLARSRWTAAD
jgi:hypothetical protein